MGKNINIFLQQISNTISKNDMLSDITIVSINAWYSLLTTMSHTYDQKLYQSALLLLKNICQNLIRKFEKFIKSDFAQDSRQNQTSIKFILKSLIKCIEVFPGSYKQIVSSTRQQSGKFSKDTVTQMFEEITRIYLVKNPEICRMGLTFQALMFRARDKSKMHYKEWISKILENMSLYFEVLEPRLFSDNKLNKVLPVED